jgi:hypothetical protein
MKQSRGKKEGRKREEKGKKVRETNKKIEHNIKRS